MKLVERHIITRNHKLWKTLDNMCFTSKNLYNHALYTVRKQFEETGKYLNYYKIENQFRISKEENYITLPNNSSQQILMILDKNFKSFFQSLRIWKRDKTKFENCPQPPRYKHKTKGRNLIVFTTNQVILRDGYIRFPKKTNLDPLKTKVSNLKQVRIVPQSSCYVIEIVYEKEVKIHENLKDNIYMGIDLGINNIASITTNQPGLKPILINGRIVKSYNQYFNKTKSKIQSQLKKNHNKETSKKLQRLQLKRNNKINYYLHHVSKFIIEYCIQNEIKNIVIGKNDGWKKEIDIGKRNNQNFCSIPYNTLIQQIQYKSELDGINVILIEESYSSKCSALDLEEIKKHEKYIGKRIFRGLFKTENSLLNADINASLNILRKVIGDEFLDNLKTPTNIGFAYNPLKVNPLRRTI